MRLSSLYHSESTAWLRRSARHLACIALVGSFVQAAKLPVPFRVDDDLVLSSMAVELERDDIGAVFFDTFSEAASDRADRSFVSIVEGLRRDDVSGLLERVAFAPYEDRESRRGLIEAYSKTFDGKWDDLKVHARYRLSDRLQYIWSVPQDDETPLVRSFSVGLEETDFKWMDSTKHGDIAIFETLLRQIEQQRVADGSLRDLGAKSYRFSERVPATGVTLHFDGSVLRWDAFSPTRPDLPALAAYASAFAAFAAKDTDAFASHYTPGSADKIRKWIAGMKPEEFQAYYDSVREQREVRLLIDADPIYVVFYNGVSSLGYDVMVRQGENYKLTSFYYETFVDSLLKSNALFIEPILLPVARQEADDLPLVSGPSPAASSTTAAVPPAKAAPSSGTTPTDSTDQPEPAEEDPFPLSIFWLIGAALLIVILILLLRAALNRGNDRS